MTTFHWAQPWAFWLLPLALLLLYNQTRNSRRRLPTVGYSDLNLVKWSPACRSRYEGHLPMALLALAVLLAILALAKPQILVHQKNENKQAGIDIMLALDTSGSMRAMDLLPNRIQAAVAVSKKFVEGRPNDRIGLVVFAGESITQCPLTSEHSALTIFLDGVNVGATGTDGTAIGNGLANCLNRLKKAEGKSKIIVLLTDGSNNSGELDPLAAAKLAKAMGVKIYTVGAAKHGAAPFPMQDPYGLQRQVMIKCDLDEDLLKKMATETGGQYFHASDTESLGRIFDEIDKMEKTEKPKDEIVDQRELYVYFLLPAIALLFGSLWINTIVWGELP